MSGVGVTWQFCRYLDHLMEHNYADNYLDLVALGMDADMMSMTSLETKHLIIKGLQDVSNPFISAMADKNSFSLGGKLTPIGIAFYITPYVNATIRMGNQEEKLLLFESMLETRAYELIPSTKRGCKGQMETKVEQACRNCNNLKNH
jgi:single-stranded DNA-specific DHH superfamily exonuclease